MLESLLDGKATSPCVIIEDSIEVNGRGLLKAFVCALLKRVDVVHVVLYDLHPRTFLNGLPTDVTSKLTIHDVTGDPLGWTSPASTDSNLTMDTDLWRHLVVKQPTINRSVAIVIDSLTKLILHRKVASTCQVLHRLSNKSSNGDSEVLQVVALLHSDLHEDSALNLIRHTATTVLHVHPPTNLDSHGIVSGVHKRASGKVNRSCEEFSLNADWTLDSIEAVSKSDKRRNLSQETVDPAANLTFNLSLTESERHARSQLVLPYVHNHKTQSELAGSQSTAQIFYQPDDADDFDEEDPDDDLDI